jgi:outer membrane immunogenic protein
MKKILLAGVASVALAAVAPANAADLRMPVKAPAAPIAAPAYASWSGCYIGAHVGWGWGKKDWSNARDSTGSATSFTVGSFDTSGAIFGGQLGCNYQIQPQWILGIEGSVSGADINGFGSDLQAFEHKAKTDFLASITGKLGWSGWRPDVLLYLKGGFAWAHDIYGISNIAVAQQDRTGWTIGLGAEWLLAFAPGWSVFLEWDHYDFGTKNTAFVFTCGDCGSGTVDIQQRIETFRIGANYRFNTGFFDGGIGKGKSPIAARY